MKVIVKPHKIELEKEEAVNEKEVNISKCHFEFDDSMELENEYVKEALFTLNGNTYKQIIVDDECSYPSEVLVENGDVELGVVVYRVENEQYVKLYNPSPAYFNTWIGSLKEAENSVPVTPTDKEQIEQMLANINLSISKEGKVTTISFTNTDGETQTETLEDGMGLQYKWDGTRLGVKREDESSYDYTDLKGDKGDAGAIKMQIVAELPATGQDDTIYLVPLEEPESQENKYAEYVWINGEWELLGKIGIQVDLTDYVKNTDYAQDNKGGVVKTGTYGFGINSSGKAFAQNIDYATYQGKDNIYFVSKGTLENVITGKDLTTKGYVDGLVGNIQTLLDTLNTGNGV